MRRNTLGSRLVKALHGKHLVGDLDGGIGALFRLHAGMCCHPPGHDPETAAAFTIQNEAMPRSTGLENEHPLAVARLIFNPCA